MMDKNEAAWEAARGVLEVARQKWAAALRAEAAAMAKSHAMEAEWKAAVADLKAIHVSTVNE